MVTVTQKGTGIRREVVTTGEGLFVVPNLAAAEYEVLTRATGFAE
jgi:hypothetical protein